MPARVTSHFCALPADRRRRAPDRRHAARVWWNIRDYRKTSRPLLLDGYKVRLRGHPDLPLLHPFGAWAAGSTTELPWYVAYNEVKHDRVKHFWRATVEHMLNAMAGVHVLVTAQFGRFGNVYPFGYSEIDSFDITHAHRLVAFAPNGRTLVAARASRRASSSRASRATTGQTPRRAPLPRPPQPRPIGLRSGLLPPIFEALKRLTCRHTLAIQ
jgi:hypothetical protein